MTDLDRLTPKQLVAEMIAAGASFSINERRDSLAATFVYRVRPGGDRARCRAIMAAAKKRPSQFFVAFRAEVQRVAGKPGEGR